MLEKGEKHFFQNEKISSEKKPEKSKNKIERKIPEKIIAEALAWHKLFRSGWLTAHELAELDKNAKPEVEGEIFKVETEKLLVIKEILDKDLKDDDFREKVTTVLPDLLPRPFQEMEGMEQSPPHDYWDPTEHTLNALELLDTRKLDSEQRLIARTALIFHDVGKVFDPKSRLHAYRSAKIACNYLEKMGFSEKQSTEILGQIRCHDALGEVTRRDGENMFNYEDLLLFFPNKKSLEIHRAVVMADIGSIPGLSWTLDDIEETYRIALKKMVGREKVLTEKKNKLPFPRVSGRIFFELREMLSKGDEAHFDDVNSEKDIEYRRKKFEGGLYRGQRFREGEEVVAEFKGVTTEKKDKLEKLLVQSSLENERKTLFILKLMGRDTDQQFVENLEKKYNIPLDNLKAIVNINFITYRLWELNFEVEKIGGEQDEKIKLIRTKLLSIKNRAEEIAKYKMLATHITSEYSAEEIKEKGESIWASDTRRTNHYEGNGVYLGAMGSFRNWGEISLGEKGVTFKVDIELSKTLPIIVDSRYPKLMLVVLSEYLDVFSEKKQDATHGLKRWLKADDESYNLKGWKLKLLGEALETDVFVMRDEDEEKMAVANTDVDPIVWGVLCRALKINRFMPMRELRKMSLPVMQSAEKAIQEIEFKDYYSGLALKATRLRGINPQEFEREI